MAAKISRVPVAEQDAKVRAKNFEEVCLGYTAEEAMLEASRCLNCKKPKCRMGCPVSIDIPAFIAQVKEGNFKAAAEIIGESSALPAVCGRVCPQETQCEGQCILGIKGEPVAIGKLERFVADWARENVRHKNDMETFFQPDGKLGRKRFFHRFLAHRPHDPGRTEH